MLINKKFSNYNPLNEPSKHKHSKQSDPRYLASKGIASINVIFLEIHTIDVQRF